MKKNNSTLTLRQRKLKRRILEVTYKNKLSHLGSCLSAVDIIDAVYSVKRKNDIFVLSNGHAGVALYTVLEKNSLIRDPSIMESLHIHPDRNKDLGIYVSTGSLGQGLPIALGMAIADKKRHVYCMISDGECAEGSIWEALRFIFENKITNLSVLVNANGWSAYDKVNLKYLAKRLKGFGFKIINVNGHDTDELIATIKNSDKKQCQIIFAKTTVEHFPFLKGQDAHYYFMKEIDYLQALKSIT